MCMDISEGDSLLSNGISSDGEEKLPPHDQLLNKCIDSSLGKSSIYAFALALGNAADAVEILCVGCKIKIFGFMCIPDLLQIL